MTSDDVTGEKFCRGCGSVVLERIEDSRAEWHSSSKDEYDNRTRTGSPTSLAMHDMGLATIIGRQNKDSSGKPLSSLMKSTITRLRVWDSRSQMHESASRNLTEAFGELKRLADKLALPDAVIEKTAYIYRKALEKHLVKGRSIPVLLAAALHIACRDSGTPRTLREIADQNNVKIKYASKCYRLLLQELDLRMPVVNPVQCISRIASKVGLKEKTKRGAIAILENAVNKDITSGKNPMALAAAALYLSCVINGDQVSQKVIALAAGVTEVTIRNRYKGLGKTLYLDLSGPHNPDIMPDYAKITNQNH
ncbi:transcription initiation factor IIB [Candidatus Nitrosotalea okcheonensis]|uniref:Transcription initiation factor IIB n=1 Tax=Candidatus Nitrosotalea okcheonensis TaxID=1903276 RepID=A0A2H1FEF3_9ARCH|nr:transcription initiation factor IIB [Candidatus Nitrosotalea okcheonensis]SMH71131.1 Transcription initiation factor IIB [Candidatus Nitrosotalea okcheonensis]